MKTILFLIVCSMGNLAGNPSVWTDDSRKIEAEQVALWEAKLLEVQSKPPEARLADLWLGLRNMGYRTTHDGHSPAVDAIYQNIQEELLAIPGHAQYFADKVTSARKQSKDIVFDGNYHEACQMLRTILPHLPSPETVQVTGEMLASQADVPTTEQLIDVLRKRERGGDIVWCYPAQMGGDALLSLNIRQMPPGPDKYGMIPPYDRESLRAWWDDVKNGRKTFSFKGQKVEYRFKPDGTWDTLPIANPPDDAPKSTKRVNETAVPTGNTWPWIIGAMVVLMAGMFWLGVRSKRAG